MLFIDMDGVLADLEQYYEDTFGIHPTKEHDSIFWKNVHTTDNFFYHLPPMPDMEELWDYVSIHNPTVLTGVPTHNSKGIIKNKREWLDKHLGKEVPMIACRSKDKSLHMKPGDTIVDDREKYKSIWIEKGGLWVTHYTAESSINELIKLGY